jgi:DNA-binding CsgD family transcriptional regulator
MEYDIESILEKYEDDYNPGPRPMAQGGRIGFYKGESVVKSHGQQIKELTEAGESSVSIAKKLKLKQQTVNSAINAMDKGIAGEKFKLSKPRSEIIKLAVNETGVNLKDPKYLEEVIKFIDDNPTLNKKEAAKIIGRKRAELVPASSYGNPGKRWNDEKTKLRRDAEKAWTNRYSNISMEDKTRGDKKFHRHHAGSLREKVGTDNTMFIDAQDNYKNIRPFENAINDIQQKQYQTNLNRNMPIDKKREIFADLKKQEDALRKKYPQFSDYKSTLVFEETPLSKTGYMMKEEMPNPELTVSEGKTGQKIKYKNITPSSDEGKKAIALNKKAIATKLKNSGFKCKLANGLNCNDPRAYMDSIKENMAKVQKGDDAAISKINKLGKSMNKLSKAAKFTGWGILTEVGFAAPFAAIDYAKGANKDEIISNATLDFWKINRRTITRTKSSLWTSSRFKKSI